MIENLFLKEAAEFHLIYKDYIIVRRKAQFYGLKDTKLLSAFCQAHIFLSLIKMLPKRANLTYV